MSNKDLLENIKKLRELTGVGFKDCKNAIDENGGDIEKSIEFLRKKGIAKASKRMGRTAAEGVVCINEKDNEFSIIEINSETDFVAKNNDFINFVKELSEINLVSNSDVDKIKEFKMKNSESVENNLVSIIAKIGEKITIGRSKTISHNNSINFSYLHTVVKDNLCKLAVVVSLETNETNEKINIFGKQLAMHIAASNPLAIDIDGIDQKIIDKELEIIKAEIINSGKPKEIAEKISKGKIARFINDNTLLNQIWIMDPKKKVSDILKENKIDNEIKVLDFIRYKVGEGV